MAIRGLRARRLINCLYHRIDGGCLDIIGTGFPERPKRPVPSEEGRRLMVTTQLGSVGVFLSVFFLFCFYPSSITD